MTKANCTRDRSSGSNAMLGSSLRVVQEARDCVAGSLVRHPRAARGDVLNSGTGGLPFLRAARRALHSLSKPHQHAPLASVPKFCVIIAVALSVDLRCARTASLACA